MRGTSEALPGADWGGGVKYRWGMIYYQESGGERGHTYRVGNADNSRSAHIWIPEFGAKQESTAIGSPELVDLVCSERGWDPEELPEVYPVYL